MKRLSGRKAIKKPTRISFLKKTWLIGLYL
jgi:hypothetical protein